MPQQKWTGHELASSAAPASPRVASVEISAHMCMYGRTHAASNTPPPSRPPLSLSLRHQPKSEIKGWICKANGCCAAARDGQRRREGEGGGGGVAERGRESDTDAPRVEISRRLRKVKRRGWGGRRRGGLAPLSFYAGCRRGESGEGNTSTDGGHLPPVAVWDCGIDGVETDLSLLLSPSPFVWHMARAPPLFPAVP